MSARGPRLVLLGKQGAGKGTQSALLAEHYEIEWVSTGDLLRAAVVAGNEIGLKVSDYLEAGELVPDDIVQAVLAARFGSVDHLEEGFILDGYPRTVSQAELLESALDGHPLNVVLHLEVSTATVLDRLAGRRVCESCGATYHINLPPARDWICDVCGGPVRQRPDDTEEAVSRRLEIYEQETAPLVEFYRDLGRLAVVDAIGSGEEVFRRLVLAIDDACAEPSR